MHFGITEVKSRRGTAAPYNNAGLISPYLQSFRTKIIESRLGIPLSFNLLNVLKDNFQRPKRLKFKRL